MQKNFLLVAIAIVSMVGTANAQIKKGAVLLGGQLGFSTQKSESGSESNTNSLSVLPVFGIAVKENLVVGADLNFGYSHQTTSPLVTADKQYSYGIGVFVRQYKPLGKGFYFFGQARAGGSYSNGHSMNALIPSDNQTKITAVQLSFYPGIAYSISRRFQLETGFNNLASINYSHSKNYVNNQQTAVFNSFGIGTSLSNLSALTIGFRVLLN